MEHGKDAFARTELLVGKGQMKKLSALRIIIFGVGGVGSWCAESLVRSGITHLTVVDSDRICETNMNRQLQATSKTVGQLKVEVLKERLLEINPEAQIEAIQMIYCAENSHAFFLERYDYIIDCIDTLQHKLDLIRKATRTGAVFFSSMGASLKMDPTQIQVAEFWDVKRCRLGFITRKRIRKGELPGKKFLCVYSEERLENKGKSSACGNAGCACPEKEATGGEFSLPEHEWCSQKAVINGTMSHITAIFGFTLAGLVMRDCCS